MPKEERKLRLQHLIKLIESGQFNYSKTPLAELFETSYQPRAIYESPADIGYRNEDLVLIETNNSEY